MPTGIRNIGGGASHGNPFVGPINHPAHVKVDVSALTAFEIDTHGYLKPGVPLTQAGLLVGAGAFVFGVSIEGSRVANSNSTADIAAVLVADDTFVAVATIAQVNQDIIDITK
jgi:hypothetical protein